MVNCVFLEVYSSHEDYRETNNLELPLESVVTYFIYKYCNSESVSLKLVSICKSGKKCAINLHCEDNLMYAVAADIPWQVSSCVYPVVWCEDTIITGLCAVARYICKHRSTPATRVEHEEGLLGFRKSCLQAPNEVSIWTKFCEVNIIGTVKNVLSSQSILEIPKNLVRFENHLRKPVRVHNVYKIARDMNKSINVTQKTDDNSIQDNNTAMKNCQIQSTEKDRMPKLRKWKSKAKKNQEIDSSVGIENLQIQHQFAEGPFFTLADLILLPSYYILFNTIKHSTVNLLLPVTSEWYNNIIKLPEVEDLMSILNKINLKTIHVRNISMPTAEDVSLYKCDPKRHNPKKRIYTKEDDIENALKVLENGMELEISKNELESGIDWSKIPDGANPLSGHLPDERMGRKSQQLENLALAVLSIAKEGDLIVDFCSGSGHLGILVAYLLPKCTVILLENKEQSLLRARTRVHEMGLNNIYFFQCNLDFFIGKFDIGIALHACGIASDLVLDKCLKANAKFVLCPCCYGSVHATDRLVYPRSNKFKDVTIEQYLCIGHAADQTHEEHPLTVRGARCMAVIDSDRARLAEETGYKVTLSRLKPLTCTPKNNLLIGVPA